MYDFYMKEYLSYFSAARMWDIPYIEIVLGPENVKTDIVDITVSEHKARFRNNGKMVHSCGLALPTESVVTRNGRKVASPELLFLELASKLSIHRLILLGLQLCSHPPGRPFQGDYDKAKAQEISRKDRGASGTPQSRTGGDVYRKWLRVHNGIDCLYDSDTAACLGIV